MAMSEFFFKALLVILWRSKMARKSVSNITFATRQFKYQRFHSLLHRSDLNDHTLVFDVEGALLKSSSMFSYFMVVAFEAGGLIRATVLLLVYPFICLVDDETSLKIMVMICFFGIKEESCRVGRAVLPKLLLEDVGLEMFEVVKKGRRKAGLSKLPRVMVESFLKEYLEIDFVVGRELKVFNGFYVGLMEERNCMHANLELVQQGKITCSHMIGISGSNKDLIGHSFFSSCKEVYTVTEAEKKNWKNLAKDKYPKPLIFHDGRLALKPTPLTTLALLIWVPCGFIIALIRITVGVSLPYNIATPLLTFTGLHLTTSNPKTLIKDRKLKGHLYACNHRTLLDPLYLAFTLKRDLVAVTYSLSKVSEILAPIKTVRLTRNRNEDARMMKRLLKQGDLVVCPEGTTCREAYLLRFSPLFSELCDEIVPVAVDCRVTMFHGTTAGGLKCLDPLLFMMNPTPCYSVQLLEKVSSPSLPNRRMNQEARFEVANQVQKQIGTVLGFECTTLNRKDKYLILAGNEGAVSTTKTG